MQLDYERVSRRVYSMRWSLDGKKCKCCHKLYTANLGRVCTKCLDGQQRTNGGDHAGNRQAS